MLTREDNELLCRVGPGTPMGMLGREYWVPALRAATLQADGAPMRVRLFGDNFVAFRATDGRLGFFDEGCPHRCTSLALARNEDNALTCIFHGWKIDVSGKVVDVPSEPPERRTEFAAKVRVRHYPVREAGGVVWVYLGRRQPPPRFYDFEFNRLPASHLMPLRALLHCNWLQGFEAVLDAAHVGILHKSWLVQPAGKLAGLAAVTAPTFELLAKPYGFREAALRDLRDGTCYARIREVVLPFFSFIPNDPPLQSLCIAAIPIDDEWTAQWYFWYDPAAPIQPPARDWQLSRTSGDPDNFCSTLGSAENNWGQDRAKMKDGHWSGMWTFHYEDFVTQLSMGTLVDRSREYLGSSDSIIIRVRRMLLEGIRAFEAGRAAPGFDQEVDYRQIRALGIRYPREQDWRCLGVANPPTLPD
ncbi:MAG TPA: Rieske 2Fe-2S domain-containing protein [Candidatus Binataceae bacterium]|nr:Rieske 2Fe-2S domain-containing protein [Candidatus Binataceae bacterium]